MRPALFACKAGPVCGNCARGQLAYFQQHDVFVRSPAGRPEPPTWGAVTPGARFTRAACMDIPAGWFLRSAAVEGVGVVGKRADDAHLAGAVDSPVGSWASDASSASPHPGTAEST